MPVKTLTLYKNWKPVPHSVFKNAELARVIHDTGYAVVPFLDRVQLETMREFYGNEHSLKAKDGGMFYSLYSKDLGYRKKVHETLGSILKPLLDEHFSAYKNIVNTFITKASGPASEFYTHQDTTAMDEYKHSPLSIWIPLQDMTAENGAMAVIEKSHWFFSPYRGISFSSPLDKLNDALRPYLKPIYLKAGDSLIFDSRIVHNSLANLSGKDRLVALCGIFPEAADFITCYKDKQPGSKIELIKQADSFILENENFYYNCHDRPKSGEKIGEVEDDFPTMSAETFEELCAINHIEKTNQVSKSGQINCNFIAEPNGVNLEPECQLERKQAGSLWQKLKTVFD